MCVYTIVNRRVSKRVALVHVTAPGQGPCNLGHVAGLAESVDRSVKVDLVQSLRHPAAAVCVVARHLPAIQKRRKIQRVKKSVTRNPWIHKGRLVLTVTPDDILSSAISIGTSTAAAAASPSCVAVEFSLTMATASPTRVGDEGFCSWIWDAGTMLPSPRCTISEGPLIWSEPTSETPVGHRGTMLLWERDSVRDLYPTIDKWTNGTWVEVSV